MFRVIAKCSEFILIFLGRLLLGVSIDTSIYSLCFLLYLDTIELRLYFGFSFLQIFVAVMLERW